MDKIKVEICCGTACYLLGAANLMSIEDEIPGFKLDAKPVNGIDRKTCAMVKLYAAGKMPVNFLEVMACPGGCQNGPCSLA